MAISYVDNSLALYFTSEPLLWVGIAWGLLLLTHSFFIHRFTFKMIRIASDMAALALLLESACFLIIMKHTNSSSTTKVILQNIFGNAVFGAIVQGCDNFLTFSRYQAVAGGTSKVHKYLALSYVIVFLYLSWWPFFTFLPIGFNQNSTIWLGVQYIVATWINFVTYLAYDIFYSGMVIVILFRHVNTNIAASATNSQSLQILARKALGHSLLSCAGIFCYSFYIPLGIVEQNILITTGIHVCLNWPESHLFPGRAVRFFLNYGTRDSLYKIKPAAVGAVSSLDNKTSLVPRSNPVRRFLASSRMTSSVVQVPTPSTMDF